MNYWIFLKERKVLEISGKESRSFLQSLITQDIRLLKTQASIFSALLTPQGAFHSDFFILNSHKENGLLLECHQ